MGYLISISVRDKIARHINDQVYVCGNSDFVIDFDFDAQWNQHEYKTARFICDDGTYVDQLFSGSQCPVPVLSDTHSFKVGVFAGNLNTTTPAYVPAKKSILCASGTPAAPPDDVYNQIMSELNMINNDIGAAVKDYLEEHPIEGTTFETDQTLSLKDGILSVNTAKEPEPDNTLPITSAAVHTTVGNINALLETI